MRPKANKPTQEPRKWNGATLRRLRESRGLTQSQLAQELSIDVMLVSRYERDVHEPRAGTILALCHALACDANELLGFNRSSPK